MMVRMGRTRKPGMAAFYNATAENPSPLAVAGPFVAGQRRASPQEEDERIAAYEKHSLPKYDFKAAVYHHILK